MGLLFILIYFIAFPAALAVGTAAVLSGKAPTWSARRRTAVAAPVAGFVPMSLPLAAVLGGSAGSDGVLIPAIALLALGLLLSVLVGMPAAYLIARRAPGPEVARPEQVFD